MSSLNRLYLFRAFRISFAVALATVIWLIFNVERGYYIPMTLIIIYAPFENDLVSNKLKDRLIGTFFGVLLAILVLQLLAINENVIVVLPLLVLVLAYFMPLNYLYATIMITVGVILMFGLLDTNETSFFSFGIARFIDTCIAAAICLVLETYFVSLRAVFFMMQNRTSELLDIFDTRFTVLLTAMETEQETNDLTKESLLFSSKVETLKHTVMLNSRKLNQTDAKHLVASVTSFTQITNNFTSLIYLTINQTEILQRFYTKHFDLLKTLSLAFNSPKQLEQTIILLNEQKEQYSEAIETYYEYVIMNTIGKICGHLSIIHTTLDMLEAGKKGIKPTAIVDSTLQIQE